MSLKFTRKNETEYANCNKCDSPLLHCHCRCYYCGERDGCECVLFDAVSGG